MRPGEEKTSSPGLELLGAPPPMALSHGPSKRSQNQQRTSSRRWPRTRLCLLKGCGQHFRPRRWRQRYCSDRCWQEALAWSRWKQQQKYRASEVGKKRRNAQCKRNRERVKIRMKNATAGLARVISGRNFIGDPCDRPGCYEMFQRSTRSPHQRFCSMGCRRAVQRVRERERRWREEPSPRKTTGFIHGTSQGGQRSLHQQISLARSS